MSMGFFQICNVCFVPMFWEYGSPIGCFQCCGKRWFIEYVWINGIRFRGIYRMLGWIKGYLGCSLREEMNGFMVC